MLDEAVAEHVARDGEVVPPWKAYPEIERFSIGWRMGSGEWHMMVWWRWWDSAGWDEPRRLDYFRKHQPPTQWLDWAAEAVWSPDESDDADLEHEGVRRLAAHGIGSYEEWTTWISDGQ